MPSLLLDQREHTLSPFGETKRGSDVRGEHRRETNF